MVFAVLLTCVLVATIVVFINHLTTSPKRPDIETAGPAASAADAAPPASSAIPAIAAATAASAAIVAGAAMDRCAAELADPPSGTTDAARAAAYRDARNRDLNRLRARGDDRSLARSMMLDRDNRAATTGELARLAHRSQDPAVLAIALTRCHGETHPDCRGLNAQTWQRRDPDSAWPWLWIASEALRRGDEVAAEAALQHSLAATWLTGPSRNEADIAAPPADDAALIDSSRQLFDAMTIDDLVTHTAAGAAANACERLHRPDGQGIARPAARALPGCRALAERLAAGPMLSDRHLASNLGAAVGWSQERIELMDEQRIALQDFAMYDMGMASDVRHCTDLRHRFALWREVRLRGEIPEVERHMKAAGLTLDDLVARQRTAAAAEAASAASAAPARK